MLLYLLNVLKTPLGKASRRAPLLEQCPAERAARVAPTGHTQLMQRKLHGVACGQAGERAPHLVDQLVRPVLALKLVKPKVGVAHSSAHLTGHNVGGAAGAALTAVAQPGIVV